MCRNYFNVIIGCCLVQALLCMGIGGLSIYAFCQSPIETNVIPIVGIGFAAMAMICSIMGCFGALFGKRMMILSHAIVGFVMVAVGLIGFILALLAAIRIEYFEHLTWKIQNNLHENNIISQTVPLPGVEPEFVIDDQFNLFYPGQDMDLEPYYRLSYYDEEDPLGLVYGTQPSYVEENLQKIPTTIVHEKIAGQYVHQFYSIISLIVFFLLICLYLSSGLVSLQLAKRFGTIIDQNGKYTSQF